jgi:hypothetical protein
MYTVGILLPVEYSIRIQSLSISVDISLTDQDTVSGTVPDSDGLLSV